MKLGFHIGKLLLYYGGLIRREITFPDADGTVWLNESEQLILTGTSPGYWMQETGGDSALFALYSSDALEFRRYSAVGGVLEATPYHFSMEAPQLTLAVQDDGTINTSTNLLVLQRRTDAAPYKITIYPAAAPSPTLLQHSIDYNPDGSLWFSAWDGTDSGYFMKWVLASGQPAMGFFGVDAVVQPAGADQAATVMGNADNDIGGLTISGTYDQTEVQALRDACEELADDVRALHALVHALRSANHVLGLIKGSA